MISRISLKEVLLSTKYGALTDSVYQKIVYYPVLIPCVYLLVNFTAATPNQITLAGLFFGLVFGAVGFLFGIKWLYIGFLIFYWLDCLDGRVATLKGVDGKFGAFLDTMCDRTVIFWLFFVLFWHHIMHQQSMESLCLLIYFMAFVYVDIICYCILKMDKCGADGAKLDVYENMPCTVKNMFFRWVVWVPGRNGSIILLPVIYWLTKSFEATYLFGAASVVVDVAGQTLKTPAVLTLFRNNQSG